MMTTPATAPRDLVHKEWDPNVNRGFLVYHGRINRARYLGQVLALCAIAFVWGFMFADAEGMMALGMILIGIATSAPIVRRFHDLNKSGWHYWLGIIPVVNIIVGLYLLFAKGTDGDNEYGPDPLAPAAVAA
jgi:uncharacterized membrane protein YhaH (DUF805 family)